MTNNLAISIISEVLAIDQRMRARLAKVLPKGLELSHFSALNHLAVTTRECTPARLASALNVSRGAITNTITRLEKNGYIHIRGDWDDARKKFITISPAGKLTRDIALAAMAPIFQDITSTKETNELKELLNSLRGLRLNLS